MTAQSSTEVLNAAWSVAQSAVVGILQAAPVDRRLVRMTITGPASSTFTLYRGFALSDVFRMISTRKGSANTWESQAQADWSSTTFRRGESHTFAWTSGQAGIGQVAQAVLYFEFS